MENGQFFFFFLLRHALPISLLMLRKKPTVLQSRVVVMLCDGKVKQEDENDAESVGINNVDSNLNFYRLKLLIWLDRA